jgi:uncharacterized protein DUF5670
MHDRNRPKVVVHARGVAIPARSGPTFHDRYHSGGFVPSCDDAPERAMARSTSRPLLSTQDITGSSRSMKIRRDARHSPARERRPMFMTVAIILVLLWALGAFVVPVGGGLIHLLLVLALIAIVWHFMTGRRIA